MDIFGKKRITKESYLLFITAYKSVMYKIALGYLSNETDSLEAVDEAVYLGYAKIKQLKNPDALKSWLTRILINECYRILRLRKREVPSQNLPEIAVTESKTSLTVENAVGNLPKELKEIIILRYFADYSVKDTALFLELPQGTVATRARKALELLKKDLISMEGGISHESIR